METRSRAHIVLGVILGVQISSSKHLYTYNNHRATTRR